MRTGALQPMSTWAEDRALLGSNPSAVPGVGVNAGPDHSVRLGSSATPFTPTPRRKTQATSGDLTSTLQIANANREKFQFTLNQDTNSLRNCAEDHVRI